MTRRRPDANGTRVDWLTPPDVLERVRKCGPIALDPCAPPGRPAWTGASKWITPVDSDGAQPDVRMWLDAIECPGMIFVNPPWRHHTRRWVETLAEICRTWPQIPGIALVPANTEAPWWATAWLTANAVCFWRGRMRFVHPDTLGLAKHGAGCGVALFAWGSIRDRFFEEFYDAGTMVLLR